MQIYFYIKKNHARKEAEKKPLYIRIRDKGFDHACATFISVHPEIWNEEKQVVKNRVLYPEEEKAFCSLHTKNLHANIEKQYKIDKELGLLTSTWLKEKVASYYRMYVLNLASSQRKDWKSIYEEFVASKKVSENRQIYYSTAFRLLCRYEEYRKLTHDESYRLFPHILGDGEMEKLDDYLYNEYRYVAKIPAIADIAPESRNLVPRSLNTVVHYHDCFRGFFSWCVQEKYLESNPYVKFTVPDEIYGTPYYITTEELALLYGLDLSGDPTKELYRDTFVLQCCIGCRIKDFRNLTHANIEDGMVHYIPHKTIKDNGDTVSVPLNSMAKAIIEKYRKEDWKPEDRLIPFRADQRYNINIKKVFKEAGITRRVSVLNTLTMKEDLIPINELASSHMARRTFIGNIYKQVKDQALVSSLTGHAPNSAAFARYRAIDKEIKQSLVDILQPSGKSKE